MARQFLTAIDLAKNELQNARVQNLASAPSTPVKGQLYMNTTDNILYWYNGTAWVAAQDSGASGFPGYGGAGYPVAETTFGLAKADGVSTLVARADHTHGSPTHDAAAHSTIPINSLAGATGIIDMNNFKITEVATPTAGTDAANKDYVDNAIAGLSWKDPVRVATTANITLSGPQTIDGVAVIAGDRVLVKNQTTASANGIYVVSAAGWGRSTDADINTELEAAAVWVNEGTTQADTAWVMTTNPPISTGTTSLTWVQFGAFSLADDSVTNAKLANMAAWTIKGNNTAATADPADITQTQFQSMMAGWFGRVKTFLVGDGSALAYTLTHNLAVRTVVVEVARATTPWDTIECDVERTSPTQVTLRFAVAPTANQYEATVIG